MATQNYKNQLKGQNGITFKKYWNGRGEKSENTIRVFCRGDVFTVHDNDTEHVKKILNLHNITRSGSTDVNTTGMNWTMINLVQLRTLLRELVIVQGSKVEVYEEYLGPCEWEPVFGSPGNLSCVEHYIFSNETHDSISSCKVLALQNVKSKIILAIVDAETKEASFVEFDESDNAQLEHILVQIQVREIITDCKLSEPTKIAVKRIGVMVTSVKSNLFEIPTADEIKRIFANGSRDQEEKYSRCIFAAAKYLKLGGNLNLKTAPIDMSRFVRLDSGIFVNLHLDSAKREPTIAVVLSNGCSTPQGVRKVKQFISQPLVNKTEINERQNLVQFLVESAEVRNNLSQSILRKIPDIGKINIKISQMQQSENIGARVALAELARVNMACKKIPAILELLSQCEDEGIINVILTPLTMLDGKVQKLIMFLDQHVDPANKTRLKKGVDENLDEIAEKLIEYERKIDTCRSSAAAEAGLNDDQVKILDQNGIFYFRTANRNESKIKKFETVSVKKQQIVFTSSKLESLNEKYRTATSSYDEHAKTIVQKMIQIVVGYAKYLTQIGELTAFIDAMVGFASAVVSAPEPWIRPQFNETGSIEISQLRHPLLENNTQFVANDVNLTKEKRLMILTGPNMGGKSTYLRSVAIAALLAQIGSFVPAESASLPIHDAIIARIGATDNLQRGISTFLHEMSECESIFRSATEKSLVIVDELGRGTSTWDGFGIAWSIAESLASKIRCLSLYATHYHEMATLESKVKNAFNMHTSVFVDDNKVTHLFQVEEGPSSTSYGIEIAQLAGFPENILKRARDQNETEQWTENICAKVTDYEIRSDAVQSLRKIIKLAKESSNLENIKAEAMEISKQNTLLTAALQN